MAKAKTRKLGAVNREKEKKKVRKISSKIQAPPEKPAGAVFFGALEEALKQGASGAPAAEDDQFQRQAKQVKDKARAEIDSNISAKISRLAQLDFDRLWEEQKAAREQESAREKAQSPHRRRKKKKRRRDGKEEPASASPATFEPAEIMKTGLSVSEPVENTVEKTGAPEASAPALEEEQTGTGPAEITEEEPAEAEAEDMAEEGPAVSEKEEPAAEQAAGQELCESAAAEETAGSETSEREAEETAGAESGEKRETEPAGETAFSGPEEKEEPAAVPADAEAGGPETSAPALEEEQTGTESAEIAAEEPAEAEAAAGMDEEEPAVSEKEEPASEESAGQELCESAAAEETAGPEDGEREAEEAAGPETGGSSKLPKSLLSSARRAVSMAEQWGDAARLGFRAGRKRAKYLLFLAQELPAKGAKRIRRQIENYYEEHPEQAEKRKLRKKRWFRRFLSLKRNFRSREQAASEKMAVLIEGIDERNEVLAQKTGRMVHRSGIRLKIARKRAELNKKKLILLLVAVLACLTAAVAGINYVTAYEYAYNGRGLGVVKNQDTVLLLVDVVSQQLSKEYRTEINIDKNLDITFRRVLTFNRSVDSTEDVLKKLTYMRDMKAKGYGLYIDGSRAAIMSSREKAEATLKQIEALYMQDKAGIQYESVGFAQKTEIREESTKLGRIQNEEEVRNKILTGAVSRKIHVVQAGDTLSSISKIYNVSAHSLIAANPGIRPERLSIGQEVVLNQAVPLLTVQTVEIATYGEMIPFETTQENSDSMYKGEKNIRVKGVPGERQVVARITKNNGVEVAKEVLSVTQTKAPVTEVIRVGTKALPALKGTGSFAYPVSGARLTTRYSRYHPAIDLAIASGTPIRAADGGTVISAGYSGSYGYVIRIDHGGGKTTLYAHCSKILVRAGEKVYKGQHIGNVGSTGRSTGPHVHFEITVNGSKVNPLNYL